MSTKLKPSPRFRRWLFLPAGTSAFAQASENVPQAIPAAENELFLWLGLGCFALVALILLGRRLLETLRRRRRARAVRIYLTESTSRWLLLRRWLKREPRPQAIPLYGWEQRTRDAELKARQAVAALRSELTPHLARMMKDRLVWTLMHQRAKLLHAQQASAEKVATLEHRLTAIQLQIRKQAEAYEGRISELEKELAEKKSVTRELLRFRVILAKQALEAVRLDKTSS